MRFAIKNINANDEHYRLKVLRNARLIIIGHMIKPGEAKLNNYLIKTEKANLKLVCLKLLSRCRLQRDYDGNVIVTFKFDKDDELASLITYGNGEFAGSDILKEAFFRK